MTHFLIEQAIFRWRFDDPRGSECLTPRREARSEGFADEWLPLAEEMMRGFGTPAVGIACPLAVFAQPFGLAHVAIVQVTDNPHAARARYSEPRGSLLAEPPLSIPDPNTLTFHFLILPKASYESFIGDPFILARRLPPEWLQRGTLPAHSWPSQPLPERTVDEVQRVLKRTKVRWADEPKDERITTKDDIKPSTDVMAISVENAESPALLGGAQVLVDGGRLVFRRPAPDLDLVEGLWTLLPASTRCRLWPASFAFSNDLDFDVVVLPRVEMEQFESYTTEEQAMDYPEGRYELNLQIAAEHNDQRELTALLNRRSSDETKRMGAILLGLMIAMMLVFAVLDRTIWKPIPRPPDNIHLQAATAASMVAIRDPFAQVATWHLGKQMFNK